MDITQAHEGFGRGGAASPGQRPDDFFRARKARRHDFAFIEFHDLDLGDVMGGNADEEVGLEGRLPWIDAAIGF